MNHVQSLLRPHRLAILMVIGAAALIASIVPTSYAYGPGCPYCTAEPVVLPAAGNPLLHMSMKWCGITEAPAVNDPTLACQSDFKTMLWRRHERASDCVWISQARLTLRSGGAITKADYTQFNDPTLTPGVPGDVPAVAPNYTDLINVWQTCDADWAAQPKGAIAVSVNRIVDAAGTYTARGIAVQGSITMPWMMAVDPTVECQLNERSLAHEAGHVLNLGHVTTVGNLMQTGGAGATLNNAQITTARNYLTGNTILDPPGEATKSYPDLVDFVFDPRDDGDTSARHLDILKVVSFDNTPTGGDFSIHLGMAGVFPREGGEALATYAVGLDVDNNPSSGGDGARGTPVALTIGGADYLLQVDVQGEAEGGLIAIPTVHRFNGATGAFENVTAAVAPYLNVQAKNLNLVICDLTAAGQHVDQEVPFLAEINFYIENAGLSRIGLEAGPKGLFAKGLRLQSGAIDRKGGAKTDLAPDEPAVLEFPPIEFPTMTVPAQAARGQKVSVTVAGFPAGVRLGLYMGPTYIDPAATTDRGGSAKFSIVIPDDAKLGPSLISVGIQDPNSAITADSAIDIVRKNSQEELARKQ